MIHAIDVARSQLGVQEATGHNDGIPADRYMRGDPLAWCAGFVLWCNENSADPKIAPDTKTYYRCRSVQGFIAYAKDQGWWREHASDFVPEANDVVFFGNTVSDVGVHGSHVGLVEGLEGGRLHTIEGNTSNKVAKRVYAATDKTIIGFARIAA